MTNAPIEYLLLWSGEMYGMRKARIPATEHDGLIGHWRNGTLYQPDRAAIRTALPMRYRAMFDRASGPWIYKGTNGRPAAYQMNDTRNRYRHTIFLQPIEKEPKP